MPVRFFELNLKKNIKLTFTRADLKLPLRRHHLGIGARDFNTGIKTSAIVRLDHIAPVNVVVANGTVVGSLWTRVTLLRPAVGVSYKFYR